MINGEIQYKDLDHKSESPVDALIKEHSKDDKSFKFPWVSVKDDLPYNHQELLLEEDVTDFVLAAKKGEKTKIACMFNHNGVWHWDSYKEYDFWMTVPQLQD